MMRQIESKTCVKFNEFPSSNAPSGSCTHEFDILQFYNNDNRASFGDQREQHWVLSWKHHFWSSSKVPITLSKLKNLQSCSDLVLLFSLILETKIKLSWTVGLNLLISTSAKKRFGLIEIVFISLHLILDKRRLTA